MNQAAITSKVKTQAEWWLDERLKKLKDAKHDTMEVNPFMAPLIAALHGHASFDELAGFLISGHFAIGHATGFGKLVDEKILPNVFGTKKLDKASRKGSVFSSTCFDNVDHVVNKGGETILLSQKASKWTIQLGQAVELNKSFQELIALRAAKKYDFKKIVVATFYGKAENLSDKYRIVRGITTGASHDVVDISANVEILAGKEFWTWIGDSDQTQKWVMDGVLQAIEAKKPDLQKVVALLHDFQASFAKRYEDALSGSKIDWQEFLSLINGE